MKYTKKGRLEYKDTAGWRAKGEGGEGVVYFGWTAGEIGEEDEEEGY